MGGGGIREGGGEWEGEEYEKGVGRGRNKRKG